MPWSSWAVMLKARRLILVALLFLASYKRSSYPQRLKNLAHAMAPDPVMLFGSPVDFILFGLTLAGVALFHHHTLRVALTGLAAVTLYKLGFTGFKYGAGLPGLA